MIEGPPLLKIKRSVARPDKALLDLFKGAMTGHVVDCMDGLGGLDPAIKPQQTENAAVSGPALTVACYPGDNMALLAAIDRVEPGDVVVCAVEGFRDRAVTGDMVAGMLKNKGAAALVTDGCVRDQIGIEEVGLPVFHAGVTPNSPACVGPGSVGLSIHCGGRYIRSGDIMVGDRDGAVVVPQQQAEDVAAKLVHIRILESELEEKVKNGLAMPDAIRDLLTSDKTEWAD